MNPRGGVRETQMDLGRRFGGGGDRHVFQRPRQVLVILMIAITDFPHVNAALNAASALFLLLGFVNIRRGNRDAHRACMIAALAFSAAFLVTYSIYHANSGLARFGGEGMVRPIYFTILTVHVLGAVAALPLVPITVLRALRGRFGAHRSIARWTWPLWMFVGMSGVVVYFMAVWMFPHAGG